MDTDKTHKMHSILSEVAAGHCLRFGYNTHYEAYNYQFEWWEGRDHHRLDFQPTNEFLIVTHLTDRYRFLPHVCYWLYKSIPEIFRFAPSVQSVQLETIKLDHNKELRSDVERMLKAAYNPEDSPDQKAVS
jgi:hypothetical protein